MDLATMRGNVQDDLKDTGNSRWTDDEIDRAIERAVSEYSRANPVVSYDDVALTATGDATDRRYDLSANTGYLWCESVEYPIDDDDGPVFVLFREERATKKVYVLPGPSLTEGEDVRFWYAKSRTLGVSSDIPVEDEELIALGAGAYATLAWANYAIDRIGVSGWTPRQYREWAEPRLKEFRERLDELRLRRVSGVGGPMVSWGSSV